MLKYLKIHNYILVNEAEIHFKSGLNVFSGETGAGKSVIIEAINTVLGGSVRAGMVFKAEDSAVIEICFSLEAENQELMQLVDEYELDIEENEIYFTKVITPSLKAKTYLNGIRSTNAVVKRFRSVLIDFHSQRDQQKLFDNKFQLKLIDAYGDHDKCLADFSVKYKEYANSIKKLHTMQEHDRSNKERYELFRFQMEEIEKADLSFMEDQQLEDELNLLNHSTELVELQENFTQSCFQADNSIFDQINNFLAKLIEIQSESIHIKNAVSQIHEVLANLESIAQELNELRSSIDLDPNRLESVNTRLDFINSLKMKYHRSIDEIKSYYKEIKSFVDTYSDRQNEIDILKKNIGIQLTNLVSASEKLSSVRKKAAKIFAGQLEKNIKHLAMPNAQIEIKFIDLITDVDRFFEQIQVEGRDWVEFCFTANLGVELQPLKSAASGGELSRFLLAVKKVMAEYLYSKTIIFDEIDTGIGGKTAEVTGEFINTIADHHQVISITHLAQIAVFADVHFLISKSNRNNISQIEVKKLDNKNKAIEIARMLSGSESDLALKHAKELLKRTGKANV